MGDMSEAFDAYHKWLGIPPDQQPADHYRLLGIGLYESDADVIEAAANQRTTYLQERAAGEHAQLTQKLLNEISQARRCLLNTEQKRSYDTSLQAAQSQGAVEAEPPATKIGGHSNLLVWGGIATSVVLVLLLVVVLFRGDGQRAGDAGMLVVRWEPTQRQGAVLQIDGENVPLSPEREFEVVLTRQPRFRHRIVMQRTGFRTIKRELTVTPDDRTTIQPNWQRERR